MGGLSFGAPLVLFGLLALPAIWWLLRLTPPRPQTETFPPLAILLRVRRPDETPAQSPWWLTLLRLLLAALVILALAAPVLDPRERAMAGTGTLAILFDDGWASASDFEERIEAATELVREAETAQRPVALAFTATGALGDGTATTAEEATARLAAATPHPLPVDRLAAAERLVTGLPGATGVSLALFTDGIDVPGTVEAAERLASLQPAETLLYTPARDGLVALTSAGNATDALTVAAVRASDITPPLTRSVRALDVQDREIGRADLVFANGEPTGTARFEIPVELRNDVARVEITNAANAGEVRLLDDSFRRRQVALVSGEAADLSQPLLSPLYYISRALEPFADIARAESADLSVAIPRLLERRPSVVVLADIGVLPDAAETALVAFVEGGGTLLRFAGPRLAASTGEDTLVPVRLRAGERQLGGSLSWAEPQAIAPFAATSPFNGIAIANDVTVSRQILAEPTAELAGQTLASLADGTPIVTAAARGAGQIVLVHTTAEATWSNLALSGTFVDMLRRIVQLSRSSGPAVAEGEAAVTLPPFRSLAADARLTAPATEARPLVLQPNTSPIVTRENPPGLYGNADGFAALNLLAADARLDPLPPLDTGSGVSLFGYDGTRTTILAPFLFAAALLLFALDALALLWLNGGLRRLKALGPGTAVPVLLTIAFLTAGGDDRALAQQATTETLDPADYAAALEAANTTRLAYVETGNEATDTISRQGLSGLSQFIAAKTALEPGEPMGVDIAADELSFFPLLYWPVDPTAPMPSAEAISRIDAYMKQGGTVVFDVEADAMDTLSNRRSAGEERLQSILGDLDIPPLEPVPLDHVLTKAFYIMDTFPGRHTGSDLWVESSLRADDADARPASAGDGVSSIMITSNDLAAAWAVDDSGLFVFPTDSADPAQREYAYRTGVNIVMYVLTGNYKADQVHVPALLERLGQ